MITVGNKMQKEKLLDWLQNPVTELLKEVVRERIQEALENLAAPSNERDYDVFTKGMVHAFREVLDWEPQLEKDESDDSVQPGESGTQGYSQTEN